VDIAVGCFLGLLAGCLPWVGGYLVCYFFLCESFGGPQVQHI
jgi:hypothetical protein